MQLLHRYSQLGRRLACRNNPSPRVTHTAGEPKYIWVVLLRECFNYSYFAGPSPAQ